MARVAVTVKDDALFGNAELVRERIEEKNDDEEIERVECPAEEAGKNGNDARRNVWRRSQDRSTRGSVEILWWKIPAF